MKKVQKKRAPSPRYVSGYSGDIDPHHWVECKRLYDTAKAARF